MRFPAHVTSDIARDRWRSIRSKRTRDVDRDGVVVTRVIEVVDKERKEGGDERDRMECSRNPGWAGLAGGCRWQDHSECRSNGLGGDLEDATDSTQGGDAAWAE